MLLVTTLLLVASLPPSASRAAGDPLAPQTQTGRQVTHSCVVTSASSLRQSAFLRNGVKEDLGAEMQHHSESRTEWSATDSVRFAADGRALAFDRTYGTIERAAGYLFSVDFPDAPNASQDITGDVTFESPLTGETLEFRERAKSLSPRRPEGAELPMAYLRGLAVELAPNVLLPVGEVERGDTWEIDGAEVERLLELGAELHFEPEGDVGEAAVVMGMSASGHVRPRSEDDRWTGRIAMTHAGRREVEGELLIVVEVDCDATWLHTKRRKAAAGPTAPPEENAPPDEVEMITRDHSGGGELLFDPRRGFVVSLDLEVEVTQEWRHSDTIVTGRERWETIQTDRIVDEVHHVAYTAEIR